GGDSPTSIVGRSRISSQDSGHLSNSMNNSRRENSNVLNMFPSGGQFIDNRMTQCIVYLDNEDNSVQGHYMMTHD
ncbi:MAG: hypothetical protein ACK56F_04075, partial [bacterium]